jgi:hypothetical protein
MDLKHALGAKAQDTSDVRKRGKAPMGARKRSNPLS